MYYRLYTSFALPGVLALISEHPKWKNIIPQAPEMWIFGLTISFTMEYVLFSNHAQHQEGVEQLYHVTLCQLIVATVFFLGFSVCNSHHTASSFELTKFRLSYGMGCILIFTQGIWL